MTRRADRTQGTDAAANPARSSLVGLDWLNFFLADVQSGVGAFLAVYLASAGWNEEQVGIALTTGGIAGILAQTPVGALVDRSTSKRALIVVGVLSLSLPGLIIALVPSFWPVIASEVTIGIGASALVPAVCAISLGLVGRSEFDRRQGRNQSFNSAGNVFAAVTMGALGYFFSNRSIFYFVVCLMVPAFFALRAIRPADIDYGRARGSDAPKRAQGRPVGRFAFKDRSDRGTQYRVAHSLSIFLLCAVLFHFANAAMLSLLGEMLAKGQGRASMMYMSACVITTQLIITVSAPWVGKAAGHWGRRRVLLVAFAVLPLRAILYTLTTSPTLLVSIQILDGVAASIFGVVSILIIADITKGSGRFNLGVGAYGTAIGIGAAVSQLVAGSIAHRAGYHASFLFLGGVAALALVLLFTMMPETHAEQQRYPAARRTGPNRPLSYNS